MSSRLIRMFVERASREFGGSLSPREAMSMCVRRSRLGVRGELSAANVLEHFMRRRRVKQGETTANCLYDGALTPIGVTHEDGFMISIDSKQSPGRRNFTIGHEICHTFL